LNGCARILRDSAVAVAAALVRSAAGVAAPVRQFEVIVGGRRFRVDLAWPAMKVGIECEGYTTHGRRRSFVPDRSRLADLVAVGWRIILVTWEQTGDPERLGALVHHTFLEAAS
jgi:very-short-patch-repair endonuclease